VGPIKLDDRLGKAGRDELPIHVLCAAPGDADWKPLWKVVREQTQAKLEKEIDKLRSDLEAKTQELKRATEFQGPK